MIATLLLGHIFQKSFMVFQVLRLGSLIINMPFTINIKLKLIFPIKVNGHSFHAPKFVFNVSNAFFCKNYQTMLTWKIVCYNYKIWYSLAWKHLETCWIVWWLGQGRFNPDIS